jgi:N-acetylglucosamine kinase-like BadF-type ATPase
VSARLLLGVDGGGTKTDAALATLAGDGKIRVIGRGRGGQSNMRVAGRERALASLEEAISGALAEAGRKAGTPDVAVLALAGSTLPDVQAELAAWAERRALARRVEIAHDSDPVLAAGTPEGWGVALIAGTGSVTVGRDLEGKKVMCGGWGHWFGDGGSGYDLGRRALTAASEAEDGMGPDTMMRGMLLEHFGIGELRQVTKKLVAAESLNGRVAAVAGVVMKAAEGGDAVALGILSAGAVKLCELVTAAANRLGFDDGFPLAVTGGAITGIDKYREEFLGLVKSGRPAPGPVAVVNEPVMGCLEIGRSVLR